MMAQQTKGRRIVTLALYCFILVSVLIAFGGWTATRDVPTTVQRLITFHGNGFKIGYPRGWKVKGAGPSIVSFTNPGATALFLVGSAPNPNALLSANDALSIFEGVLLGSLGKSLGCHKSGSGHASVAGVSWNKAVLTCNHTRLSVATVVVLAVNHPADSPDTHLFLIAYLAGQNQFSQDRNQFFRPMLGSFAFR